MDYGTAGNSGNEINLFEAPANNGEVFSNLAGEQMGIAQEQVGAVHEAQENSNQGQAPRDFGLENAVGIVTVGAANTVNGMGQTAEQIKNAEIQEEQDEHRLDVPAEAKDDGKIEEAWVKRAKDVIAETRDNPNKRVVQIALLREQYMLKRFNRVLGEHNE